MHGDALGREQLVKRDLASINNHCYTVSACKTCFVGTSLLNVVQK